MLIKRKENALWVLIRSMSKRKIFVLLFALLRILSTLCIILVLPMILNKVIGSIGAKTTVKQAVLAVASTYAIRAMVNFFSDLLKAVIIPQLESEIKMEFFQYTQDTTEEYNSGQIADLVDKCTSSLSKIYIVFFQSILPALCLLIAVITSFAKKEPKLAFSTFVWVTVHSILSVIVYKITRPLYVKSMEIHNGIQGFIVDNFNNKKTELFFNKKNENMQKFYDLQEQERKTDTKNNFLVTFLVLLKEINTILIQGALFVKILFTCNLNAAEFLMFFHINRSTILYIGHLTEKMPDFIEGYSKANNIKSIIQEDLPPKDLELMNPKGYIVIENLYIVRENRTIIDRLNITFSPGQKVAIVGKSGEGKSTLLNAIAGICRYEGEVFIDNINLKHLSHNTINENFSYIFSSQKLFNDTLKYNITLGNPSIKDEELFEIMDRSALGYLKNRVNESLNNLSSGEKRRVIFARSLWNCKTSCVLLADEPFANLDQLTIRNMLKTLLEVSQDKTTLVVDHSKSFLEYSDLVLFFFNGNIYVGTHKNLLSNPLYQRFVELGE